MRVNLASPLLVIRDDASDKVRVCVAQGDHQFGKLLFVQLANCPEHSFTSSRSKGRIGTLSSSQTNNLGYKEMINQHDWTQLGGDPLIARGSTGVIRH